VLLCVSPIPPLRSGSTTEVALAAGLARRASSPANGGAGMGGHFLDELRSTFDRQARRPALAYRGRTLTYGDLDALAERCAAWLQGLGVGKGDRVALSSSDKLAFLAAHLGTMMAGGVSLPLNPRLTREEL